MMYLTKEYFNRFQFTIVGVLVIIAVAVGTIQSMMIVKAIRRNT